MLKAMIAGAVLLLVSGCGQPGAGSTADANAAATTSVKATAAPVGQSWIETVVRTPEGGYRMGNPDAAVKLVEYGSRSCPHCAAFDAEAMPTLKNGPIASGKLSYEFRDYPVHAALDIGPILLGQCVPPGSFFPMLDQMMASQPQLLAKADKIPAADQARLQTMAPNQVATFLADYNGYVDFVKQRGVPEAKARACLSDAAALDRIAKSTDTANQQFNVMGTPTFILNGKVVPDTAGWEQLQPALRAAGAL